MTRRSAPPRAHDDSARPPAQRRALLLSPLRLGALLTAGMLVSLSAAGLAPPAAATPAADTAPGSVVRTIYGPVRGMVEDGVFAFKGREPGGRRSALAGSPGARRVTAPAGTSDSSPEEAG